MVGERVVCHLFALGRPLHRVGNLRAAFGVVLSSTFLTPHQNTSNLNHKSSC